MTQFNRTLLALGTVGMFACTYVQGQGPATLFLFVIWMLTILVMAVALWLVWRNRSVEKRIGWIIVIAGELLFSCYLIGQLRGAPVP